MTDVSEENELMNVSGNFKYDRRGTQLMTATDFIRHEPQALEVPENSEMTIWAGDEEFTKHFASVQVQSHKDLQLLGLLPQGLDVDKLLSVIRMDDESTQRIAQDQVDQGRRAKPCGCGCDDEPVAEVSYGRNLRQMTNSLRRDHHPMLATLLSEHYQSRVELDSPLAAVTWRWAKSVNLKGMTSIVAAMFSDITINRGATLHVDKSSKLLMAGNIRIHRTGKLVYPGGYLKIWAHAAIVFNDFSEVANIVRFYPWLQQ
jgi:hypothetical protein